MRTRTTWSSPRAAPWSASGVWGRASPSWCARTGAAAGAGSRTPPTAGQATLAAIYPRAANPNFYPDQLRGELDPWKPRELWLFDSEERDLIVDVSEAFELKLEALRAHRSQEAGGGGIVEAARASGERHASAEHPAEAFLRCAFADVNPA